MPRVNLTDDQRAEIAQQVRDQEKTIQDVADELGVTKETAKKHVNLGYEVLAQQEQARARGGATRKDYGEETMQTVVQMRDDELRSWKNIAKELGLGTPGTARRVYRNAKNLPRNAPLGRVGRGGRLAWVNEYPEGVRVNFQGDPDEEEEETQDA